LDSLAQQLVTEVNQQHQAGFGLDGSTGLDFFSATGTTAGTIAVALTDPRQIAASDNAGGVPGNNGNALAMAALQDKPLSALGGATLNEYYAATAAGIGSAAQQADSSFQAQKLLQDQLQSHWAEISGVSLDEELVNMMQYQRAFEASSRVITMSDQLMQTILNLKQ
jgi:flagellar hook-associated protein 1 FlgK